MATKYPDGGEIAVLANALAVAVCRKLNLEEQNILGNLLAMVGASMLSIAAINQANSVEASSRTESSSAAVSDGTDIQDSQQST